MAAFTGRYTHSLDHKGRVSIPAAFRRNGKSSKYMLLRGNAHGVAEGGGGEWERRREEKFASPNIEGEALRAYQRYLGDNASEVGLDQQGRIMIPPHLLKAAGLGKEAMIVGAINWMEVWDPVEYMRFEEGHSFKANAEEVYQKINELRRG